MTRERYKKTTEKPRTGKNVRTTEYATPALENVALTGQAEQDLTRRALLIGDRSTQIYKKNCGCGRHHFRATFDLGSWPRSDLDREPKLCAANSRDHQQSRETCSTNPIDYSACRNGCSVGRTRRPPRSRASHCVSGHTFIQHLSQSR